MSTQDALETFLIAQDEAQKQGKGSVSVREGQENAFSFWKNQKTSQTKNKTISKKSSIPDEQMKEA